MATVRISTDIETGKIEKGLPGTTYLASVYSTITFEIDDDGLVAEVDRGAARYTMSPNFYLHFTATPTEAATEAQIATIASRWLRHADASLLASPGADLCRWAFVGLTPQDVSSRYGDGKRVALA